MAWKKKEKVEEETPEVQKEGVIGRLSPEQYFKWRLTVEEMDHVKTKVELANMSCLVRKLELEKANLHLYRAKTTLIPEAQEEYNSVKGEIESELGFSLNDCAIDPYTYSVRELKSKEKENN